MATEACGVGHAGNRPPLIFDSAGRAGTAAIHATPSAGSALTMAIEEPIAAALIIFQCSDKLGRRQKCRLRSDCSHVDQIRFRGGSTLFGEFPSGRRAKMNRQEARRKVIREWMALPRDKRHTEEQAAHFAAKAVQRYELPRSRRDPYLVMMDWLVPRTGKP
jgi:hypothetical protein